MKYFSLLIFLLSMTCFSQKITSISDIEFENATFNNLSFLKEEFKNVKIIGLGESVHYMGGTNIAKIKMIKYLHEECGFDILAFESPMYNLSIVNEFLKKDKITVKEMGWNISGVWNSEEMKELFEYIIETQKTKNPLIYAGFDESFFNKSCKGNIIEDYTKFINNLEKKSNINLNINAKFYDAIFNVTEKCYSLSKIQKNDTLLLNNKFKEIKNALKKINIDTNLYFEFWKQITNNLQSVYRKNYKVANRDFQMAENVKFLVNKQYPDKKVILWAATTHLLYNVTDIEAFNKNEEYEKNKMGVYIKKEFKEQYYLLAFTALQGKIGFKGYLGIGKQKIKTSKGSLEYYINQTYDTNFAYIPLTAKSVQNEINKNKITKSILWGLEETKMDLPNVVDGIFYLKNEKLTTF